MKNIKRILSLCAVAAILLSSLLLSSCSGMGVGGSVEDYVYRTMNADSLTIKVLQYNGTVKADLKNKVVYTEYEIAGVRLESYCWFDAEEDIGYNVTVTDSGDGTKETNKQSYTRFEFIQMFSDLVAYYFQPLETYRSTHGAWEKTGNVYTCVMGEYSIEKMQLSVEDESLVYRKNYEDGWENADQFQYMDINKTKIEIPQSILNAE